MKITYPCTYARLILLAKAGSALSPVHSRSHMTEVRSITHRSSWLGRHGWVVMAGSSWLGRHGWVVMAVSLVEDPMRNSSASRHADTRRCRQSNPVGTKVCRPRRGHRRARATCRVATLRHGEMLLRSE
jgi:hypothetical protein